MSQQSEGPPPYLELGRRVAHARNAAGIKQTDLAKRVGISHGYLGMIEVGRRRPEPRKLQRMAVILRVPYMQFAVPAGYMERADDPDEIPPGVVDVVRRLVARGLGTRAFECFEQFAAVLLLEDGRSERSVQPDAQRQTNSKRRANHQQRLPEDDPPPGEGGGSGT